MIEQSPPRLQSSVLPRKEVTIWTIIKSVRVGLWQMKELKEALVRA